MPKLTRPEFLPGPFAYNGDRNSIPDTTGTSGAASWAEGFPPVTQLPLAAGGLPPQRNDFNGVNYDVSNHVFFQQSGCFYPWSASLQYPFPAIVLGSDGKLYLWVSESGAGTAAGPQDPVADTENVYWTQAQAINPITSAEIDEMFDEASEPSLSGTEEEEE